MGARPARPYLPRELDDLFRKGCSRCSLGKRRGPVYLRGRWEARAMFIGEAPGKVEEELDAFFVGPAGALVEEELHALGLPFEENFLVNNCVWCRPLPPPGDRRENRAPKKEEVLACQPNFLRSIELHRPDLVVLVGGTAAKAVLKDYAGSFGAYAGRLFPPDAHDLPCEADAFCLWHPAYVLRNSQVRPQFVSQLTRLRDYMLGRGLVREMKWPGS